MRLKFAIVALAAACTLALVPYTVQLLDWQYDPAQYPKLVAWAGCHARVVTNEYRGVGDSYYIPSRVPEWSPAPGHTMVVGTAKDDTLPYYAGLFIVLHETGHCLQDESGWLWRQTSLPVVEQDADRRAADLACGFGLDGRKILRDTFVWAHDTLGYDGDPDHGSLAERMGQADNAHVCDKRLEQ